MASSQSKTSFLLFLLVLLAGCSTTPKIQSVWKDPAYQAHPHRIMVIGMSHEPLQRRIFEDEYVKQLRARGADAIASHTLLPDTKQDNQEEVAKMVAKQGADTVLLTRLVSKRIVKTYTPGTVYYHPVYYGMWRDYYHYGYDAIATPGYMIKSEYALMETTLYDARSEKLIWAADYEAELSRIDPKRIESYVALMLGNLAELGLLGE